MVTTDASIPGCGAVWNSQGVQAYGSPHGRASSKCFGAAGSSSGPARIFQGDTKEMRVDQRTTPHWWLINHHGGLRYPCLNRVAQKLLLCAHEHLFSVRTVHLPGVRNWAAELLSRGSSPQFGCEPHLGVFLMESGHALSIDALAHRWPKTLLYVATAYTVFGKDQTIPGSGALSSPA